MQSLAVIPHSYPPSGQPPIYFLSLWICLASRAHVSGIIPYLSFSEWLLSLSVFKVHPCCGKCQDFISA